VQRLCMVEDIPEGDAIGVESPLGELVVARRDGSIYAYRNQCPHLGIELNFQPDVFMDLDQQYLMCANHGALFRLEDGHCVWGPCAGEDLQAVAVQVTAGEVLLSDPAAAGLQS
jgi:nitrite reductase/ring-hydroxylating ferredoxin subunit